MVIIIAVDDPIKKFIVLDPLLLSSGRVVSVEEAVNLGVCNCLFKLQAFHKLPQGRIVAGHEAHKPIVSAFGNLGGGKLATRGQLHVGSRFQTEESFQ